GEGTYLSATRAQRSNVFTLLTKGNGQPRAPAGRCYCWKIVLHGSDVGNMERAMFPHPANMWLIHTDLGVGNGHGTKMSPRNHSGSLAESQANIIDSANPCRTLDDGVEDRLHVRRRAADDPEYLTRCRLML